MELKFRSDTKQRKEWFTGVSFSHPAKMSLPLQLWIIKNYSTPGETILDPMAGSGTILVACSLGRNVIALDLEQKFADIMWGNWEKIKQRGPQMGHAFGQAQIIQGDARELNNILCDKIITSTPYANQPQPSRTNHGILNHKPDCKCNFCRKNRGNKGAIQGYRQVDSIITSPPYAEAQEGGGIAKHGYTGSKHAPTDLIGRRSYMPGVHGEAEGQIGNLPYGGKTQIDHIITSPPYSEIRMDGGTRGSRAGMRPYTDEPADTWRTQRDQTNIGNLRSDSYLSAMLAVYKE